MKNQSAWVRVEAERAREKGITVLVDGVHYDELSKEDWMVVFEQKPYMIDYEGDDSGRIISMNFCGIRCL
jgi:predicted Ser/Thr protein kinase